mgnify:CR=1
MSYYITQGTRLTFEGGGFGGEAFKSSVGSNALPGLLEVGEIALNGAGGSYDKIEVTCLADTKHEYVDGLVADADSNKEITFKFLYDQTLFGGIKTLMDAEAEGNIAGLGDSRTYNAWKVKLTDGSAFTISGDVASITLDSVATNDKLTFTVVVAVHEVAYAPII